jgi:hypothetical protein
LKDGLLPDYIIINGQLRCAGFHLTVNGYKPPIDSAFDMSSISFSYAVEWIICNLAESSIAGPEFIRNYSVFAPHFDTSCWYKWFPLFNLSRIAEIVDLCTHFCLSLHRIHDGVSDCINSTLDETTITRSVKHSKNHCLNCITQKKQAICVPTGKINYGESICEQGEDIYVSETNVAIKDLKCTNYDASECHIIRDHISQSLLSRENVTVITSSVHTSMVYPFRQYCDTYFDTETGVDESVDHCMNKWICATNEYRCLNGQCIPFDWLCDGKKVSVLGYVVFH